MIKKLKRIFSKKKKKYSLPYKFGFVKWAPITLKTGNPVKRVEIFEGDDIKNILPFINYNMVRLLEKEMGIPIFDMTQGESMPSGEITDIWNPAQLELIW